jgi:N6-L-threonylcarbamoyladenine synthase
MRLLLAIETTCDETSAAVVNERLEVLSSVVSSQEALHLAYGGVVPELASRAHVERILPVIHSAIQRSGIQLSDLGAISVAHTPGLAGSLLVGLAAAKSLALALGVPLLGVNHLHAHIYACRIAYGPEVFPCVGMVVSGGHTLLLDCPDAQHYQPIGSTIDDAAGEAFDKVATLLGLPYPGGPSIERAAAGGNPRAVRFPRPFLRDRTRLDFSFSGLKTAVRYQLAPPGTPLDQLPPQSDARRADLAASFQAAVVDVLVGKALQALEQTGRPALCLGGGVAANGPLRTALERKMAKAKRRLFIAPRELCTDNAVMGALAFEQWNAGEFAPLDLDIAPGVVRFSSGTKP